MTNSISKAFVAAFLFILLAMPGKADAKPWLKQDGFELVMCIRENQTLFIDSLVCDSDPARKNLLINADGLGYYPAESTHRLNADYIDWKNIVPGQSYTLVVRRGGPEMKEYKLQVTLDYKVMEVQMVEASDTPSRLALPAIADNEPILVYWGDAKDRVSYVYRDSDAKLKHERFVWKGNPIYGTVRTDDVCDNAIDHTYSAPGTKTVTILSVPTDDNFWAANTIE